MVSLTTYTKDVVKVVLFTEIRGKEHTAEWTMPKIKKESAILRELKVIHLGLSHINKPVKLEIYVDNQWIVTALNVWLKQWQQNGWKKSNGKDIGHKELWKEISKKLDPHDYVVKMKG